MPERGGHDRAVQETRVDEGPITRLLRRRADGEADADAALARLVYDELHALAEQHLRRERAGHTLTPTDLIHEAWLRLDVAAAAPADRSQFFGLAARRMRQVLVDHARRRLADKRGGGGEPVTLSALDAAVGSQSDLDALALEQALVQLEAIDARKARVVELRYFAGLEVNEIAELLGISRATALRDWEVARAFLHLRLS
jgi:RNA polymerase sigma factor (TIGR02999 family)